MFQLFYDSGYRQNLTPEQARALCEEWLETDLEAWVINGRPGTPAVTVFTDGSYLIYEVNGKRSFFSWVMLEEMGTQYYQPKQVA